MKKLLAIVTVVAGCAAAALPVSGADKGDKAADKVPKPKAKTYPEYPKTARLEIGDAAPDFKLPGGDVIFTQGGKLDPGALHTRITKIFGGGG